MASRTVGRGGGGFDDECGVRDVDRACGVDGFLEPGADLDRRADGAALDDGFGDLAADEADEADEADGADEVGRRFAARDVAVESPRPPIGAFESATDPLLKGADRSP